MRLRRAFLPTLLLLLVTAGLTLGNSGSWTSMDVEAGIDQAAREQGVSPALLTCIAMRESGLDPYAVSPGGDLGAFQYHRHPNGSTLMDSTPWAGESPFDPYSSAQATAWLIARGYGPHWSTYRGCVS